MIEPVRITTKGEGHFGRFNDLDFIMAFEFKQCYINSEKIEGLFEIQPKIFGDARGYFLETYSEKDFFEAGLKMKFVQDNQSKSSKGVLRGLHFQTQHPQGKLVRAL